MDNHIRIPLAVELLCFTEEPFKCYVMLFSGNMTPLPYSKVFRPGTNQAGMPQPTSISNYCKIYWCCNDRALSEFVTP